MAKGKTAPAADALAAGASERKTTDKEYKKLLPHAEVVVKVGPRQRVQGNKVVTVEEAREVIFTKAGYEAMDRNDEGETTHIATKVVGIPSYEDVDDEATGGKRKELVTLYFAEDEAETDSEEDK